MLCFGVAIVVNLPSRPRPVPRGRSEDAVSGGESHYPWSVHRWYNSEFILGPLCQVRVDSPHFYSTVLICFVIVLNGSILSLTTDEKLHLVNKLMNFFICNRNINEST